MIAPNDDAPDRAHPAEHDHGQDEDRERERELIGIDDAEVRREERAGYAAQRSSCSVRQQFRANNRNAHACRRALVLAQRDPRPAHA
jgi:hypothetical protein